MRNSGASQEAAAMFESILKEEPESILKTDIHYGSGFAWADADHCQDAIHHLQKALDLDPDADRAPPALKTMVECGKKLDQEDLIKKSVHDLWVRYPLSPEAKAFLEKNDRTGEKVFWSPSLGDYFKRASTFYSEAYFERAILDLKRFLKGRPASPSREKAQFKLAMAHVRLKQYPQARILFKTLSKDRSSYRGQATEWLARVLLRQGKGLQLIALSQSQLSGVKSHQRSQIQWMCGIWYEDQGDLKNAVKSYQRAADLAGSSRSKFDALWRQGWLYYQHGNFQKSHQSFSRMLKLTVDRRWVGQAHYWAARSLAHLGLNAKAQKHYWQLAHDFPMTYYGQLAQTRLAIWPADSTNEGLTTPSNHNLSSASLVKLKRDYHYQKAQELATLGFMKETTEELLHVSRMYRSSDDVLFEIAVQFEKARAYNQALIIAKRYFRDSIERKKAPRSSALWTIAYPKGYLPAIERYADPSVDPYLIAGIIREESLYNPEALSPVGAIGLMQLMPATAERVATRIGLPSFDREDLFSGEKNVQLGTQYVSQLFGEYGGKVVRVIAAYNAGPNAVKRWVEKNGHREEDEFVELISYRETRRYVKRVLTSYYVYHDLYSTRCSGLSLDKVC